MSYRLYLCGVEITDYIPDSVSSKISGKNKTLDTLSGKTISFLRSPGVQDIPLTLDLPLFGARRNADYYTSKFLKFFNKKKPTQFILTRTTPDGKPLEGINVKVAIWDYAESEDASRPFEKRVSLALKEYVDYGTETIEIKNVTENGKTAKVAVITKERETHNAPTTATYKVKDGDTLWKIAAMYLGSPSRYKEIAELNKISNPLLVPAGTELRVPQ